MEIEISRVRRGERQTDGHTETERERDARKDGEERESRQRARPPGGDRTGRGIRGCHCAFTTRLCLHARDDGLKRVERALCSLQLRDVRRIWLRRAGELDA